MATTIAISDDIHNLIIKKQMDIFQEKGKKMKMSNILEEAKGIDFVGKE